MVLGDVNSRGDMRVRLAELEKAWDESGDFVGDVARGTSRDGRCAGSAGMLRLTSEDVSASFSPEGFFQEETTSINKRENMLWKTFARPCSSLSMLSSILFHEVMMLKFNQRSKMRNLICKTFMRSLRISLDVLFHFRMIEGRDGS